MRACPTCQGFLPDRVSACPNCRAPSRWGRVAAALAAVAGSVTLMACYGVAAYPNDACPDEDNDGFLPACYSPTRTCDPGDFNCDCNDGDPTINPGAYDPSGDGVDRDCDGKDGQRPGWQPPVDASVDASWSIDDAPPAPDAQ